jgi:hypothetical protein
LNLQEGATDFYLRLTLSGTRNAAQRAAWQPLALRIGNQQFSISQASPSVAVGRDQIDWQFSNAAAAPFLTWFNSLTVGSQISVSLIDPRITHVSQTQTTSPTTTPGGARAVVIDPTQRSWPLTPIAKDAATEWWFPIGQGDCEMKDEQRPWTWDRWNPPTAERCGWLSIPDVRAGLDEPVDELAFRVYTALLASPEVGARAGIGQPRGPTVKLAVWAVYPHPQRQTNSTWRLKGPHAQPITVCLPGSAGQTLHGFDEAMGKWVELEPVEPEREGHICGLHGRDLGLLAVASD